MEHYISIAKSNRSNKLKIKKQITKKKSHFTMCKSYCQLYSNYLLTSNNWNSNSLYKIHHIKTHTHTHKRETKNISKMAGLSSLKNSNSLHIFSMKPSTPISKLKTLIQTFIFSHLYRATRAFAKAKSLLLEHVRDIHFLHLAEFKRGRSSKKKLYFGSFRLHYNWCASHVMPLSEESYPNSHIYYDASWNVLVPTNTNKASTTLAIPDGITSSLEYREPEGLSRYLEWLEEEKGNQESSSNEIDKLADLFIADCHEKFRLEKQESYRIFQEMMARSV